MNLSVQILATCACITMYVAGKNGITDPYQMQYMFAVACVYALLYLAMILRNRGMQ